MVAWRPFRPTNGWNTTDVSRGVLVVPPCTSSYCGMSDVGFVQYGLMLSAPRSWPGIHTGGALGSSGGLFAPSVALLTALIQICLHCCTPFPTHALAVFDFVS